MLFIEFYSCRLDASVLLTLHITLPYSLSWFFYLSFCVRQCIFSNISAWPPKNFCLFLSIFISLSPSLFSNSVSNHFQLSHAITSPAFCPTAHSASPPPIPLIVLFSTEGYSCLQGYENVRKAHSIFSYVNSHFPPEQTHFPRSDLPCCTSHFPPLSLHYLSKIVRGKWIALLHCLSVIFV